MKPARLYLRISDHYRPNPFWQYYKSYSTVDSAVQAFEALYLNDRKEFFTIEPLAKIVCNSAVTYYKSKTNSRF